jgi:2'-5' RNA ligase
MYRLFVAVDLPDRVQASVAGICHGLPEAKWVAPDQLHLTLRFIGAVDEALSKAIKVELAMVTASAFSLNLQGVGCFPPHRYPHVLWVGLGSNTALLQLQQQVEHALVRAGIPAEQRPFSPHITIARFREGSKARVDGYLAATSQFVTEPFPVAEFYLYSSTLTREGASHRREVTYPLTGGQD